VPLHNCAAEEDGIFFSKLSKVRRSPKGSPKAIATPQAKGALKNG
jgi:hypothetical protein